MISTENKNTVKHTIFHILCKQNILHYQLVVNITCNEQWRGMQHDLLELLLEQYTSMDRQHHCGDEAIYHKNIISFNQHILWLLHGLGTHSRHLSEHHRHIWHFVISWKHCIQGILWRPDMTALCVAYKDFFCRKNTNKPLPCLNKRETCLNMNDKTLHHNAVCKTQVFKIFHLIIDKKSSFFFFLLFGADSC